VGIDPAAEAPISARRAQTRERLMAAARAVFAEQSVEGASVEEICDAAGFTRGAFYSNFSDRSELVLAMIQHSIAVQFAAAQRAIAVMKQSGDRDTAQLVAIALGELFGGGAGPTFAGDDVITDRSLMLYAARDPGLREPYLQFMDACGDQVAALIGDALAHAKLELTVPPEAAVELLIATHSHLQELGLFGSRHARPELLSTLLGAITRTVDSEETS
jgi:AcrR family transcriptional regulator